MLKITVILLPCVNRCKRVHFLSCALWTVGRCLVERAEQEQVVEKTEINDQCCDQSSLDIQFPNEQDNFFNNVQYLLS